MGIVVFTVCIGRWTNRMAFQARQDQVIRERAMAIGKRLLGFCFVFVIINALIGLYKIFKIWIGI